MASLLVEAVPWVLNAAAISAPLQAQANHLEGLRTTENLHKQAIKQAERHHKEEVKQAVKFHEQDMAKTKQYHLEGLVQNLRHHTREVAIAIEAARRENLRDVWIQKGRKGDTLLITAALMYAALVAVIVEGRPPQETEPWLMILFSTFCALSFAFLFACIWATMRYQSRMSEFSINNARKAKYSCGKQHHTVDSFYNCHCLFLARSAHVSFYLGSVFVCVASAIFVFSHYNITFNNLAAGYIYLMTTLATIVGLVVAHLMFPTRIRLDKHEDEDEGDHLNYHFKDINYNSSNLFQDDEGKGYDTAQRTVEKEVVGAKLMMNVDGATRAISEMIDIPHAHFDPDHPDHPYNHPEAPTPLGTPQARRRRETTATINIPKEVFVHETPPEATHTPRGSYPHNEPDFAPPPYPHGTEPARRDGDAGGVWNMVSRVINAISPFKPAGRPAPQDLEMVTTGSAASAAVASAVGVPTGRTRSILKDRTAFERRATATSRAEEEFMGLHNSSTDTEGEEDATAELYEHPSRAASMAAPVSRHASPRMQRRHVGRSSITRPSVVRVRTVSETERDMEAPEGFRVSPEPDVAGVQDAISSEQLTMQTEYGDAQRMARRSLGDPIMMASFAGSERYGAHSGAFDEEGEEGRAEDDSFHSLSEDSSLFSSGGESGGHASSSRRQRRKEKKKKQKKKSKMDEKKKHGKDRKSFSDSTILTPGRAAQQQGKPKRGFSVFARRKPTDRKSVV